MQIERKILSIEEETNEEFVASLSCGHKRHLRHDPPRETRPRLLDSQEREAIIGTQIDCGRCLQRLIPDGFEPYFEKEFDTNSVPEGLLQDHSLKPAVWGKLSLKRGSAEFVEGESYHQIRAGQSMVVLPEIVHYLKPGKDMAAILQFFRAPKERD